MGTEGGKHLFSSRGKDRQLPSKSTFFRANSFQATVFRDGMGFQLSLPSVDLKSDDSKRFCHLMQTGFLRGFRDAGPAENPCDLPFQTSALKALPSLLSLCALPCLFCIPSGTKHAHWRSAECAKDLCDSNSSGTSGPFCLLPCSSSPSKCVRGSLTHFVVHAFLTRTIFLNIFPTFLAYLRTKMSFLGFRSADLDGGPQGHQPIRGKRDSLK